MPKSKSRPRLSDNLGTGGGRPRSARKRKVTPTAESSPSVQNSVASQRLPLPHDPSSGPSDQPQMLAPQILVSTDASPAETPTQAQLPGNVLPDPPLLFPRIYNFNQQTPSLAFTTQFSLEYHVDRSVQEKITKGEYINIANLLI